jgi:glycine betaine/proline transport system ATP-binding protein
MISVANISVAYANGPQALAPTSLSFAKGDFTVLLGASGAGKSTLLRTLNGLVAPSAGEVVLEDGRALRGGARLRAHRRRTGMIFQQHQLIGRLSVVDNVLIGRLGSQSLLQSFMPRPKAEMIRALEAIARVGLIDHALRRADQLSGGQQQRVGIARSLAVGPDVWFLDEPFSALDPLIRREMQDEFLRLQKLLRKTIVFITHDFDEAIRLGDRIGIMKDGRLVQLATPEVMVSAPADDYVREFTRNAPRDRVLTVGSIASPALAPLNGVNVLASAKIGEAAAIVLASERPLAVIDAAGRAIGSIDRAAMIRALYPDERP